MKKTILFFLFSSVLTFSSFTSFWMNLSGKTTITVNALPVRVEYPDGRIIQILNKNSIVSVTGAAGDGRGRWLQIESIKNGKKITGFIDSRFTSYEKDFKSGRIFQPKKSY